MESNKRERERERERKREGIKKRGDEVTIYKQKGIKNYVITQKQKKVKDTGIR